MGKRGLFVVLATLAMATVAAAQAGGLWQYGLTSLGIVRGSTLVGIVQQAPAYPPGFMFSTLLNGILMDSRTGGLTFDNIQAVFLPQETFGPREGHKLCASIKKADGTELAAYAFYVEHVKPPYSLLSSYTYKTGDNVGLPDPLKLTEAGDYVIEFDIDGKLFYRFPFGVSTVQSNDPFKPGTAYFLEGPWNEYGYLFYYDAQPNQPLQFKMWFRHKGIETQGPDVRIQAVLETEAGKVVGRTSEDITYCFRQPWTRYEFMFRTANDVQATAGDLLKDGNYVVRIKIQGQDYAVFKFSVAAGRIQYQGRTDRATADPLTFIEGGRDAWWLKKL